MNGGGPLLLTGFSVEAEDDLFFGFGVGGCDEDLISDDGGRSVPSSGDGGGPRYVSGLAPFGGHGLRACGLSVGGGTAPRGPVF